MKMLFALFLVFVASCFAKEPMLLKVYKGDENLSTWMMSEKLDGVRGIWNGNTLKSRANLAISTPKSWLSCFPNFSLDGEIYSRSLDFERITSIVNSSQDKGWSELEYHVFDLPNEDGSLIQRLEILRNYLDKNPCPQIKIIEQLPAISHENVVKFLDKVTLNGGEGVVVRDPNASYQSGRSDKILKLKKFLDDECEIIKINAGRGKFQGFMRSLTCRNLKDAATFKIGSGFSDKMRKNPPAIGTIITYKYQNLTKNGLPRFPVFLRIREGH
ncbi:DNA ligase [Campylobacter sp. RM13119]|uniref:DNA ligase n=1 Tax=Campylobacter californiensis TaxID=1032243 RepID=UPI00147339E8|nr:DNA ligase [Campylobacter sp. RM13119]MBE3605896.1 DNA ligase [Campylobacter sp. RM13119]